jgi:hypothetical protein
MIDVEFQGIGPGLLQFLAQFQPAGLGHAVQARHHRDFQARLELAQMIQIAVQAVLEITMVGEKALRLPMAQVGVEQKTLGHGLLGAQLLLEQGMQHDGRRPGILQPQHRIQLLRQGRGRGHQGVLELQAHIVGG